MQSGLDIVSGVNEPDLASLLKSLDVAHFDGAASVPDTATQTAEAKDHDEPIDDTVHRGPLRRSIRKRSRAEGV